MQLLTGGMIVGVLGFIWSQFVRAKKVEQENVALKLNTKIKEVHEEAHLLDDAELGSRIRTLLKDHSGE